MIDVKTADRELLTYIRPQTFPLAVRMLGAEEEIPDRAKRPARALTLGASACIILCARAP